MDYETVMLDFDISREDPVFYKSIRILDNPMNNDKRKFYFRVQGDCGIDAWVEICILNDTGR